MPNISYTEAMKEAATLANTDTVILDTLEISHPDISSIYLVNDRVELIASIGPGDGYLDLPGIAGNYASVLAADITLPTDFLDARIIFGESYRSNPNVDFDVIPLSHQEITTGSVSQAWFLKVQSNGDLQMPVWNASDVQSTFDSGLAIPTDADGIRGVFRGTDDVDPSQASVQFFYTTDGGTTWVELVNRVYAVTATTIASLKQATSKITIGERLEDTPSPFFGTVKYVELYGAASEADLRLRVDFRSLGNNVGSFTNDEGVAITVKTSSAVIAGGDGVVYTGGTSLINPGTVDSLFDSDGVVGSYGNIAYSPTALAMGDFTFQIDDITQDDWATPGGYLFSQWKQVWPDPETKNFYMQIAPVSGLNEITLYLFDSATNNTRNYTSTGGITVAEGASASIRITRTGSEIRFFVDYGAGFVQVGATVTGAHTTVTSSDTLDYEIGAFNIGVTPFGGTLSRIRMWSDAAQTTNVFDVNFASVIVGDGTKLGGDGAVYTGGAALINPGTSGVLQTDGVVGSYASHAYEPAAQGLGDFTIQVDDITQDDWANPDGALFAQWKNGFELPTEESFRVVVVPISGLNEIALYLTDATGTTTTSASSSGITVALGASASIRITRTGSQMRFFVDYGAGAGFVQVGATVVGVTTLMASETSDYQIGAYNHAGLEPFGGTIGRCRIWSDATQTTNVFDLNFADTLIGDGAGIVRTNSVTYEPVGFKFKLPSITGNGVQDMSLEFSNVDRRVNDFIDSVEASLDPVIVTHRVYLSGGDLNSLAENSPPLQLTLSDIEISAFSVRARASFLNIVNKHYPTEYYDRDRFPSI